jgi:MFS family permease
MAWIRELSRQQKLILLTAWLGWVFDIFDSALFAFAKVPMLTQMLGSKDHYRLHGPEIEGKIQMVFLVGWAIGGLIFGLIADRFGRTKALLWTILIYATFTGLTALCTTPEQVAVARFISALGIGGEWAAGAALIAEIVPNQHRAKAAVILQSAAAVGPILAALTNLLTPRIGWQGLFVIGIAPAFLCLVIRTHIQEPASSNPPALLLDPLKKLLGRGPWRSRVIVACVIGTVGVAGAGILPFWMPNLVGLVAKQFPPDVVSQKLLVATMLQHTGTLLGVMVGPLVAERLGRRALFGIFYAIVPVAMALMLYGEMSYLKLCIVGPVVSFFAIGVTSGFVLYFPELFPSSMRATGAGLAYNVGRIFSAPMPALIGVLASILQTPAKDAIGLAVLLGGGIYLIGLAALPFAVETKGKPLPTEAV